MLLSSVFLKQRLEQNEQIALLTIRTQERFALFKSELCSFLERKLDLKMYITLLGFAVIKHKREKFALRRSSRSFKKDSKSDLLVFVKKQMIRMRSQRANSRPCKKSRDTVFFI